MLALASGCTTRWARNEAHAQASEEVLAHA